MGLKGAGPKREVTYSFAGTYDEAQYEINLALADYFDGKALKDLKSNTEKYQKNVSYFQLNFSLLNYSK